MKNKLGISILTFSLILLLIMSMVLLFHLPPYIPLFLSFMITFIISLASGFSFIEIAKMSYDGIKKGLNVMVILLLIGALVSIWKQNGTLPALIYYSSYFLKPEGFLLSAFIITSVISMVLGTAIGTASTIGIIIIGLAHGMGYPLPLIAGAVISGSYIGDRTSLLSGNVALLSDMGELESHKVLKTILKTAVPVYILTALIYYVYGLYIHVSSHNNFNNLTKIIVDAYNINPLLFVTPILIIVLALFRIPTKYNLFIAVIVSYITSLIQGYNPISSFGVMLFGFKSNINEFKAIFSGGGMISILPMIGVVSSATALSGILEGTGMIKAVFKRAEKIKNARSAYLITMLLSSLIAIIACNQALAVILPSRIMLNIFKNLGIQKEAMVRAIADSGIVLAGIIPWNLAAMMPSLVLGVKVTAYLPYAYLNLLLPLLSIIFVFLENRNLKANAL